MKNLLPLVFIIFFIILCTNYGYTQNYSKSKRSDNENNKKNISDTWIDVIYGIEFVKIPAGCIEIGLTKNEENYLSKDKVAFENLFKFQLPRHNVCVDSYWISKHEVTVKQFRTFILRANYKTDSEKTGSSYSFMQGMKTVNDLSWSNPGIFQNDDYPVVNVSWNDAKAMAEWLTNQGYGIFRLPSEAEWEYACRAGKETIRFWGDQTEKACDYANIYDIDASYELGHLLRGVPHNCKDGFISTAPVGNFKPNDFGLYDMIGNVAEWCEDADSGDNYQRHSTKNPVIVDGGEDRVLRGGGWASIPVLARSAERQHAPKDFNCDVVGFRLVMVKE